MKASLIAATAVIAIAGLPLAANAQQAFGTFPDPYAQCDKVGKPNSKCVVPKQKTSQQLRDEVKQMTPQERQRMHEMYGRG